MPRSLTVPSADSDEPVDKQKPIEIVCKLDKNQKLGLKTKDYIEVLRDKFPNLCHGTFNTEAKPCFANTSEESCELFNRKPHKQYHMDNQG